ncbi:putative flavin-containing monooxygenase-like protein [Phaeomoniella chlamydospora]|uniref:Putative flavin-containing monooxygenase-like protein n=1 Tax=Phaeomoniella chlamydospora TaxID=158046 RepID=A0A0G2EFY8_PHACM|nr:putative flavin-containing monooxygenase-like protein [Phaeomoniella chlamydospora]
MSDMTYDRFDDTYDVVVVGAGISGINMAHHVQSKVPHLRYTILEARNNIGGTWDLFRYPGIRSDTDLLTFGFEWKPWTENQAIADGESIARYLHEAAASEGIDRHIKFRHRVIAADWVSESQTWNLIVDADHTGHVNLRTRFLILGTGYYDYLKPLQAQIPGLYDNFKGKVVHPQFWPEDLDYAGKRIVIVGSGATAITLLPSLAAKGGLVTMLQRSPTYILSIDNTTGESWIHKMLPKSWSSKLSRWTFMTTTALIYYLCRAFPSLARSALLGKVTKQLPNHVPVDPHFQPIYRPWDQRLCFTPDGDFFKCMRESTATVATGRIKTITEDTIMLESGQRLEADIIVTATGLKLDFGGHIHISVDKSPINVAEKYAWRTSMLQDVPNLAFIMGYVNASWTLGAETTAQLVCRLLRYMEKMNFSSAVPRLPASSSFQPQPMWNLDATYVRQAEGHMPRCGETGPWKGRTNYFLDLFRAKHGSLSSGLHFEQGSKKSQ